MLLIALWLFWTASVLITVNTANNLFGIRVEQRMREAQRLIDDSPYFQHLGMRPPKKPVLWSVWIWAGVIWAAGCLFLAKQV